MKHGGKRKGAGRKQTGRVRNLKLSALFTAEEREKILEAVKKSGKTQSDYILERTTKEG